MFDRVFLPDPGLKSTFAQNKSCRPSIPLQLLFWPNFKFLYESLSFGWSNASKNRSKFVEPHCSSPVLVTVLARRPCRRLSSSASLLHASTIPANFALRAPTLSTREAYPFVLPFIFFLALGLSRAQAEPPPALLWPNPGTSPQSSAPRAATPRPSPTPPIPELD